MKLDVLFVALSVASLVIMIAVDLVLGARAEFINAWSVVERLFGRPPSAGGSAVYRELGAIGEFLCVLAVNAVLGGLLTLLFRFFSKR